jgi:pimeloyl-ACP methyl ester carboxylesterase/N-acetylglutamate synthase-like GNAT family acetyltransferase
MKASAHRTGLALSEPSFLQIAPNRRLAYHRLKGRSPAVLFCGGYTSDMTGTKALALERWCRTQDRAYVRFDYGGHGESDGRFADGTIGAWAADALAIVDRVTAGPLIVVGSSMGGWIMLLVALARPERVHALLGIAAAPDFTEDLLLPQATEAQRRDLARQGSWLQPSAYGEPYPVTAALIEGGRRHLLLRAPIAIACPVHLLHGQRDPDVPWQTSLRLADRLQSENVTIELIKAGDHRLSTEADLARITAALARLIALQPVFKPAPYVRDKGADDQHWVEALLQERWGSQIVVVHGASYDAAALPALVAGRQDGLATYRIDGDQAELITLDARAPGQGTGSALITALVQRLEERGVRELCVTTTNDNLRALCFYQRRGFRITGVRCGAVDDARRLKPSISATGQHGIPISDEIELRLRLETPDRRAGRAVPRDSSDSAGGRPAPP